MLDDEQYVIETWEDEPSGVFCKKCGHEMDWVECDAGCEDGYHDGYEEDPLWFSPGEMELCEACKGLGGWWECYHCREEQR